MKNKIFISQPMRNKTNEEIENERMKIIKYLDKKFGSANYEIIDSFFKNAPHEAKPLWFLGKSLQLLSTADFAVFAPDWENARGCRIEHDCAIQYGIKIIYIEKL